MKRNEEFISTTVYLYIEFDENTINECLNFNFRNNIYVKDMIKDIINNYNLYFEEKNVKIKLNPEGLGYDLINYDTSENQKPSKKPFLKNQKLKELNTKVFKLKYDPQDIMINFERKKLFKCTFC
jgi:hypothetical protein